MKIFIAGCGRTGTTLIRDLMSCFQDTHVLVDGPYGEAPFSRFASISRTETHLLIKRTGECWQTLSLLPDDVGLIYCIRHPFDVLTSTHPLTQHVRRFHISLERWTSEYEALRALRVAQPNRHIFILRYEDLIHEPNLVQDKLAGHFNLIPDRRFTENAANIHIFKDSIEKWQKSADFSSYLETIPRRFRSLIHKFCEEFEYTLPVDYVSNQAITVFKNENDTYLSLLHIGNPNELEILDDDPFFWMGDRMTTLDVKSSFTGNIRILFEARPGPSYPESTKRNLRITAGSWSNLAVVRPGPIILEVPVQTGENEITLQVIEKPTVTILPNGDTRPLMLGVLNLRIEH
jgi:hypothetical protein